MQTRLWAQTVLSHLKFVSMCRFSFSCYYLYLTTPYFLVSIKADLGNSSFLIKSLLKIRMSHKGFYRMLGCICHLLLVTQQDIHSSETGNLVPLIDAVQSKYSSIPSASPALRFSSCLLKLWRRCHHFLFCSLVWSLSPELWRKWSAEPSRAVSRLPEGWLGSTADWANCCSGEKVTCLTKLGSFSVVITVDLIPVCVCVTHCSTRTAVGKVMKFLLHFSFTAQFMVPLFVGNGVDVSQLWFGICKVIKQQETVTTKAIIRYPLFSVSKSNCHFCRKWNAGTLVEGKL